MKKSNPIIFLLFFFFCKTAGAQFSFVKQMNVSAGTTGGFYELAEGPNHSILSASCYFSQNTITQSYFNLTKFDKTGNLIWSKRYTPSPAATLIPRLLTNLGNGTYLMAGNTYWYSASWGNVTRELVLLCVNDSGNVVWSKYFQLGIGSGISNYADNITALGNGDFFVVTSSGGAAVSTAILLKFSAAGNLLWSKSLGVYFTGYYQRSVRKPNGNIVFLLNSGSSNDFIEVDTAGNAVQAASVVPGWAVSGFVITGHNYYAAVAASTILKLDSAFSFQWAKQYTFSNMTAVYQLAPASQPGTPSDMGCFFSTQDATIGRIDNSGTILWSKKETIPIPLFHRIMLTSDSSIVFTGYPHYLYKCDTLGTLSCFTSITYSDSIITFSASPVTHTINSFSFASPSNLSFIVSPSGGISNTCNLTTAIDETGVHSLPFLSPNPTTSELRITNAEFRIESAEVYDVVGARCLTPALSKGEGVRVDVSKLAPGIYFVKVKTEKGVSAAKFVKQ